MTSSRSSAVHRPGCANKHEEARTHTVINTRERVREAKRYPLHKKSGSSRYDVVLAQCKYDQSDQYEEHDNPAVDVSG
jgi:hypothetical protein